MSNSRQKILMCAPDHYGVEYVINPWMEGQLGHADRSTAHWQWQGLRNALTAEADILTIAPVPGLPDLVFTANAGFVLGDTVVVSRFRSPERQAEEAPFREWFEQNGFIVADWPQDVFFEGAGDALIDRGRSLIWCGHGFRSDLNASNMLEDIYGWPVIPLHLVDARFYHLDTCLCPLDGGWLMYFPPAFDAVSQRKIEAIIPLEKRIIVGEKDAQDFACNAVDLNGRIFMNNASEDLQNQLRAAGFKPTLTPLTEFLKAGGAAKCLTLKLQEHLA